MCRFSLKKPIIRGCNLSETAPRFLSFSQRVNESNNRRPSKWEGSRNGCLLSLFFAFGHRSVHSPSLSKLEIRTDSSASPYPYFEPRQEPTKPVFSQGAPNFFRSASQKTLALGPLTGRLWGVAVLLTKRQKIIPFGTIPARRTKQKGAIPHETRKNH